MIGKFSRLYQVDFADKHEAGAFVAALSRFLNYPQGAEFLRLANPIGVWLVSRWDDPNRVRLVLNESALQATETGFGPIPGKVALEALPEYCRSLILGRSLPAWGVDDAVRQIEQALTSDNFSGRAAT